MLICVDYDNLPRAERLKGAKYVISRVLQCLGPAWFAADRRAEVRLYGGWYEQNAPTRHGQTIAAELQAEFPRVIVVTGSLAHIIHEF